MANIIQHMMLYDYQTRPSVETLLNMYCISKILQERKIKPRINYLANHRALQDPMLSANSEIPIADINANNTVDDGSEDDGITPLVPLDGLENTDRQYQILMRIRNSNCAVKLFADDVNEAQSSTSENAPLAASSASSNVSTPPSLRFKLAGFSPLKSSIE